MPEQLRKREMAVLMRPLTVQELEAVAEAARIAIGTYDAACADPKVVITTPMHAAMLRLRNAMEGKL